MASTKLDVSQSLCEWERPGLEFCGALVKIHYSGADGSWVWCHAMDLKVDFLHGRTSTDVLVLEGQSLDGFSEE